MKKQPHMVMLLAILMVACQVQKTTPTVDAVRAKPWAAVAGEQAFMNL